MKPFIFSDRGSQAPNLWGLCADHLAVDVLFKSSQFVSFSISVNNQRCFLDAIYASTNHVIRRDLWRDLQSLIQSSSGPWLCIGDFNSILGSHEQRGGGYVSSVSCSEFKTWSDACCLHHLPTLGAEFTWTNNRSGSSLTERRLDRSLCNDAWLDCWSHTSCTTLTRVKSDHHPLLMCMKSSTPFPKSFKFQSMWLQHEDCKRLVAEV